MSITNKIKKIVTKIIPFAQLGAAFGYPQAENIVEIISAILNDWKQPDQNASLALAHAVADIQAQVESLVKQIEASKGTAQPVAPIAPTQSLPPVVKK